MILIYRTGAFYAWPKHYRPLASAFIRGVDMHTWMWLWWAWERPVRRKR